MPKYLEVINQANKLFLCRQICLKLPQILGLLQPDTSKRQSRASWPQSNLCLPPSSLKNDFPPSPAAPLLHLSPCRCTLGPAQAFAVWSPPLSTPQEGGLRRGSPGGKGAHPWALRAHSMWRDTVKGDGAQPLSQEPRVSPSYQIWRSCSVSREENFDQKNSNVFMRLCMPPCGIFYEHLKT